MVWFVYGTILLIILYPTMGVSTLVVNIRIHSICRGFARALDGMHGFLFRIVSEVSLVSDRVALKSTYLYETALLHRYIQGRDSGRLLWWTDVRIATLSS
jgi:hypothetical protein